MKKTFFPESFIQKYSNMLGSEWNDYFSILQQKIPKSIWINSNKVQPEKLKQLLKIKNWKFKELEFSKNAVQLEDVARPGNEPEFHSGMFNLQEKAAMLPALALDPKAGEKVLDACAAPGNKTIQLSNLANNSLDLFAIEKNAIRFKSLKFNMVKFGVKNCKTICADFLRYHAEKEFDKILLDAPCSSEGYVRKEREALKGWSEKLVERKANVQKKLLLHAFELLKENGILVYSTCSFSIEENEEIIHQLLRKNSNAQLLPMEFSGFKTREGLNGLRECARIYPQDNNTQPFFIAKIRKT